MGMNDHDNESQPQPAEPSREMSLTNDSLVNGETDAQGQNRPGQNRGDPASAHAVVVAVPLVPVAEGSKVHRSSTR